MSKYVAPMIVLFTDFGSDGPYVGQMKAAFVQHAPNMPVVDLLHNAPRFNTQASAHLLAAYISNFSENSVVLAIVDPGVGHAQRKPVAIKIAQRWYVGPENGLFDVLVARAIQAQEEVECWEITWRPENLSSSFHGRDLFAPVAARLACGEKPPGVMVDRPVSVTSAQDLCEVIFIDHYGNAISGVRASIVDAMAGVKTAGQIIQRANTFSDVAVGQNFCYENANGLIEIAINQGNAASELNLVIGSSIEVHR